MKYFKFMFLLCFWFFWGCASNNMLDAKATASQAGFASQRHIIRTASLSLEVKNVNTEVETFSVLVQQYGGYVKSNNKYTEKRAHVTAKIPVKKLDLFINDVSKLGKLTSRSTSTEDATEQVIDIDARIKNLIALRARYRALLDKASTILEVVSIEKELSKIQTEIDSIQGRRNSLLDQVAMSSVKVTFEQKTVYGPLGYLGKGLTWVIGKLFVLK